MDTEQHLKRIQDKLQQLLKQHVAIQKENSRLKEELNEARKRITIQQHYADELRQQVTVLKLNAGEMNDTDKKDFEKKLNNYIKEIDRCIALLGE